MSTYKGISTRVKPQYRLHNICAAHERLFWVRWDDWHGAYLYKVQHWLLQPGEVVELPQKPNKIMVQRYTSERWVDASAFLEKL